MIDKQTMEAGEIVFREGDPGDQAYVIETGKVEVTAHRGERKVVLSILGPGQMIGEMAIIDDRPRTATIITLEETTLIPIDRQQIHNRIDEAEPLLQMLLDLLLKRFRRQLEFAGANKDAVSYLQEIGGILDQQLVDPIEQEKVALEKMRLESELKEALPGNEFELHYQPIVKLATGAIAGFEALIRWNHPDRGFIAPNEFIGLAEETDLIIPMGYWILREAIETLVQFEITYQARRPGSEPLFMSVNVSGRQLTDSQFPQVFKSIIQDVGISPERIKLEITETVLINYSTVLDAIKECKNLGAKVALDDFGTGYSSLSYLNRFPFDTLKIDQTFVLNMLENAKSHQIVKAILALAHGLQADVVAEGVETEAHKIELENLNCEYAQGYYFYRPLRLEDIISTLQIC